MIRFISVLTLVAVWAATGNSQAVRKQPQTFVIHRPTIVAFFPPVTSSDLDNDEDTNQALSDFQFYVGAVRARLQKIGIDFYEADASSFRVRVGSRIRTFQPGKIGV